ncbi:asparaginase, partial [Microbacterium sp. BF1]|uniref:asparaginase n=1 Tax=Microbacterium sp. BF1 TaxID=2821146 RepID=UPI002119D71E
PAAWPSDSATRDELVREHGVPTRVRMNCSGKHAVIFSPVRRSMTSRMCCCRG